MSRIRNPQWTTNINTLTLRPQRCQCLRISPLSRSFSSTPIHNRDNAKKQVAKMSKEAPPYPYGPNKLYTQSNFGLYGGARTRFGNIRAKSVFKTKVRRKWHPNVQHHKPYSEALDQKIPIKVTTRVMKTIDKVGGLDNYLLSDKSARIKALGPKGWLLRWQLMQSLAVKEKFDQEREKLGLPTVEDEETTELRQWWEGRIANQPTKSQKARNFALRNQRQDIWRFKHSGPSTRSWQISQWVERSQELIEERAELADRIRRIALCKTFGAEVAYGDQPLPDLSLPSSSQPVLAI